MELRSCSNFYEFYAPTELEFNPAALPQIKLVYLGNIYYYTPRLASVSEEVETGTPTITLIYRENTYKPEIQTSQPDLDSLGIRPSLGL